MDGKEDFVTAEHWQNDQEKRRQYALSIGQVGSTLEAAIYDQAFLMKPGFSMSTITALRTAADRGVRIYTITQTNANGVLSIMQTDAATKQDIANAVNAGKRVTAAQNDITVAGFNGMGYIIEDPQTGAAAYLISGGTNGGNSPAGGFTYPMPQVAATPILGFILGSTLRSAGMGIVATGGVATGLAVPALVGACFATIVCGGALILAALIPALIIYSSQASAIEDRYPRTSRVFRHYTRSPLAFLIGQSKFILGSSGGTFTPNVRAVYVEEPIDPLIACPPTGVQSALKTIQYQLPLLPGETPQIRANGYVEVEVTRAGYWDAFIGKNVNGIGSLETYFLTGFLYYGPFSIAIEEYRPACY